MSSRSCSTESAAVKKLKLKITTPIFRGIPVAGTLRGLRLASWQGYNHSKFAPYSAPKQSFVLEKLTSSLHPNSPRKIHLTSKQDSKNFK